MRNHAPQGNPKMSEELLTVPEAAALLRCSAHSIYNYLASGRLRGIQITQKGTWKIPKAEVERFTK